MQPREFLQNVHQMQNPRALPVESGISDTSIGASPRYVDEESCYLLADATRRVTTEICVSIQALEHDQHQVSMKFSRDQGHPGSCSCAATPWMHVITDHLAWSSAAPTRVLGRLPKSERQQGSATGDAKW